eukprot:TRINITY_DN1177_c0_g1_i1.p2 TRINITY_DN1177_c0_g1~~TRINITY_DN1177_c0_g1_i1.p2  ORF type:complete len:156 (+),score=22.34 TRINITY_DN1177_c0_g1_i1:58-468(+)
MKVQLVGVAILAISAVADKYPVYSPGASDSVDTCQGVSCKAIDCQPPFKYKSPDQMGTCCPLCWADEVKTPEDRSWAKGMSGGVGMNNNADPTLCRDVMCPPLHCPETEQMFDGRCCTKCKSAAAVTPADLAASYN